jgi:hypothetical protein
VAQLTIFGSRVNLKWSGLKNLHVKVSGRQRKKFENLRICRRESYYSGMKLLLFLLFLPGLAQAKFTLEAVSGGAQVEAWLQEASLRLPNSVKQVIDRKLTVSFRPLADGQTGNTIWGRVSFNRLRGKKSAHRIELNDKLLARIASGDKAEREHALGTLLHEIGHIYDFQNALAPKEKEFLSNCFPEQDNLMGATCEQLLQKQYSLSDSPLFLKLTGWKRKGIFRQRHRNVNQLNRRSIDLYELKNPQEAFAVNFEFFLLDSEFQCRKPSLHRYFVQAFSHEPFPGVKCDQETRVPSLRLGDGRIQFFDLNPDRIYQIHYLFAGKGKNIMSRWGHSMLRIVSCAPHRREVNEECMKDRAHHVVISFRADITNFQISYWKGLTGKYPSKLFLMPLAEVLKEYTQGELRDVYSIPLKMNPHQQRVFVEETLARYWNYEGKYYFLSNNCADETLNLLKHVYPEFALFRDLNVITPLGLDRSLKRLGLVETEIFQDPENARRRGYLFESNLKNLTAIHAELKTQGLLSRELSDARRLVERSTSDQRQGWLEAVMKLRPDQGKGLLGKLVFLEDAILNMKLKQMDKRLGEVLFEQQRLGAGAFTDYQKLEQLQEQLLTVELDRGYGLPLKADQVFTLREDQGPVALEIKQTQQQLMQGLMEMFRPQYDELQRIQEHKNLLLTNLINF